MHATIPISVIACALLVGCGSFTQLGLSNAPVLGGATPDHRVHDAIANGRDACERSAFPPGEVLRGHIPPCESEESKPQSVTFSRAPSTKEPILPSYWLDLCPWNGVGITRAELGLTAVGVSSRDSLVCEDLGVVH
jgi:hypothetical protein